MDHCDSATCANATEDDEPCGCVCKGCLAAKLADAVMQTCRTCGFATNVSFVFFEHSCAEKVKALRAQNDSLYSKANKLEKLFKEILENKCTNQLDFIFWHGKLLDVLSKSIVICGGQGCTFSAQGGIVRHGPTCPKANSLS